MEEDTQIIISKLLGEAQQSSYPTDKLSIRDRYKDVALLLHKKQHVDLKGSFLSFGSRRSSVISSYGNTPTVIRRSLSSNGMIEYAVEQIGSLRWKGSRALPSVTMEEKEAEELEEQLCMSMEKIGEVLTPNSFIEKSPLRDANMYFENKVLNKPNSHEESNDNSMLQNRKSFSQYDIPPARISTIKLKGFSSILETNFDLDSNTGSVIDLKGTTNHSQLKECEEISKENGIRTSGENDMPEKECLKLPEIKSQSSELGVEILNDANLSNHERANSVSERSSRYFKRNSVRSSLRDLPRRSPTPPRKSPRKSSKNYKDKIVKNDFCSLNVNGTIYSVENLPLNKQPEVNEVLPPLVSQSVVSYHSEKLIPSKNELYELNSVDLEVKSLPRKRDAKTFYSSKQKKHINQVVVNNENVKSECSVVIHPSSYSSSVDLVSGPPHGKVSPPKYSSYSPPSFQRAFNRHRSHTQQHQESATNSLKKRQTDSKAPSYLHSKLNEMSQVRLISFTHSTEEEQVSKSLTRPKKKSPQVTKFIVTNSHIRSIPYDPFSLYENDLKLDIGQTINLTTTNSSRLCSIM